MKILTDANNNRASVDYFGSEQTAQKALDSLKNCSDCSDCSGCSGCYRCSDCSDCYRCSGCSRCYRCSDCSGCSGCSRCSDSYRCSDCSGCSDCSDCSGCSDCSDCYRCSGCSGKNVDGKAAPKVPIIPEIHKKVFAAASTGLAMDAWHTCEKKHCRGGWVTTLAGAEGKALEKFHGGTLLAAMLIYDASDPDYRINPARFFDSEEAALADMKRLAEKELKETK